MGKSFRREEDSLAEVLKKNKNIKLSEGAFRLLGDTNETAKQLEERMLKKIKFFKLFSVATKCLNYYFAYPNRLPLKEEKTGGQLFGLNKKILEKIAEKCNLNSAQDKLAFYGHSFYNRANMGTFKTQIENEIKNKVIKEIQKGKSDSEIKSTVEHIVNIPYVYRNQDKNKLMGIDFYFAIGDGNKIYGKVHTINRAKKDFQILLVLVDEYNWSPNSTYFFKTNIFDNEGDTYDGAVETRAFKKAEKAGEAKPFLTFFVDPITISYKKK